MNKGESLSLEFAKEVLQLAKDLREKREVVISNQISRSATSVGANIREAQCASSKKDFLNKLVIAFKESNETIYWLQLIPDLNLVESERIDSLLKKAKTLHFLLSRSIKTTRQNLKLGI